MQQVEIARVMKRLLVMVAVVVCCSAWARGDGALPRVGVTDGRFVEVRSGRAFEPRGFNYMRLRPHPEDARVLWHGTFSRGGYDGQRAASMLGDLESHGFNVVRVFVDPLGDEGIADAGGLSKEYLNNLFDFLECARRHRVHVIVATLTLPRCSRYIDLAGAIPAELDATNAMFLHQGHINSKARYMADVAAAVRARDPALLSTVFAYEIDNESHYLATAMPFSATFGTVKPADGITYDLSSQEQKQAMADRHAVRLVDACVAAVRGVDPEAMVSASVFTFAAVGRSGPGKLHQDQTGDPRFPVRPLALVQSQASYVDVHLYPDGSAAGSLERNLRSIEGDELVKLARQKGKPLVIGEFGVGRSLAATAPLAATVAQRHLRDAASAGFDGGWLYWTYDSDGQDLWTAKADGGAVFQMLAAEHRRR